MALTACSTTPPAGPWPDYTSLPPGELLGEFLENESTREAVKFTFSGDIEVKAGGSHRFRGAGGYTRCSDLRIQLTGPLGLTLLDYVNAGGTATLVTNQITEEGDDEALQGLKSLMEIFTLALVDRCQAATPIDGEPHPGNSVAFTSSGRNGTEIQFTLDREKAVLLKQTVTGGALPASVIEYSEYTWSGDYWLPGRIGIQSSEMPVSINMEIGKWKIGADLPDHFFLSAPTL